MFYPSSKHASSQACWFIEHELKEKKKKKKKAGRPGSKAGWLIYVCYLEYDYFSQQNLNYMSDQLEKVLLEHTYPLLHSFSLPPPRWADDKREQVSIITSRSWCWVGLGDASMQ